MGAPRRRTEAEVLHTGPVLIYLPLARKPGNKDRLSCCVLLKGRKNNEPLFFTFIPQKSSKAGVIKFLKNLPFRCPRCPSTQFIFPALAFQTLHLHLLLGWGGAPLLTLLTGQSRAQLPLGLYLDPPSLVATSGLVKFFWLQGTETNRGRGVDTLGL